MHVIEKDNELANVLRANFNNTIEIINSLLLDKPIKPKSFRNRTSSAPEKNRPVLNGGKNA